MKRTYPEMRWQVKLPNDYNWSECTLTNISSSSNILSLDSGQKVGSVVTPQITNVSIEDERKKDITKVIIIKDETLNDGFIDYYASNDGGSSYIKVEEFGENPKSSKGIIGLKHGEKDNQSYYYDLRIKAVLSRSSESDTSPQLERMVIVHNYK